MEYVYDTIISKEQFQLCRSGRTYRLVKRARMGEISFYTFSASDHRMLLVVPRYAEQYAAATAKYEKFPKAASLEKYEARIKRSFSPDYETEEEASDIHEDGVKIHFLVPFRDIRLEFFYEDEALVMLKKFTILNTSISGERVTVDMSGGDEE